MNEKRSCWKGFDLYCERLQQLSRALRHRNYRLFFGGEVVSLSGLWMQRVAMSWLVYRLTSSVFLLGAVDFVGQLPVFFLASFAGVYLEGWDLRRVIIICQILSMVHAFLLAILTLSGVVTYWHIIVLSVLLGVVNAFEIPARQAFIIHMVEDRQDLGNAIALNSSLFNVARLLGPSLAGVVIALVGEGICFLMNGFSYGATLWALFAMKLKRGGRTFTEKRPLLENFFEGIAYVRGFFPIRAALMALVVVSFFGLPYLVLLPVFAKDILSGGPQTLGFLTAASGMGALGGSFMLALRKTPVGLGKIMALAMSGFGICVALFAFSRWFPFSLLLMAGIGFTMISSMVAGNTLIQTLVDDDKRGRVMSLFIVALTGIAPFGSLFAGWLASKIDAPLTLACGGFICVGMGGWLWKKYPVLWEYAEPVYKKLHLID